MKRYLYTLFLIVCVVFGSHSQNAVLSPKTTVNERLNGQKTDTVKVVRSFTYDTGCTYGKVYDKNGKPLSFTYDDFEGINRKQKKKFKKK
jgi:hypothetical protein